MTNYSQLIHDIYSSPLGWEPQDLDKSPAENQARFWQGRANQLLNIIIGMVIGGSATTEQIRALDEQLRHPQST